jgi:hypothetical protein
MRTSRPPSSGRRRSGCGRPLLLAEAIAVEAAGTEVPPRPEEELAPELAERLAQDPELAEAFDGLTPGRQREYNLHVSRAKRASTRERRVDTIVPRIYWLFRLGRVHRSSPSTRREVEHGCVRLPRAVVRSMQPVPHLVVDPGDASDLEVVLPDPGRRMRDLLEAG